MTDHEADPQGSTVELSANAPAAPVVTPPPPETQQPEPEASPPPEPVEIPPPSEPPVHADGVSPGEREVVFVPLAVNIGDGFKFGCGFFLAMVIALLAGFVVLAALFLITGIFGLNLPLTR